MGHPSFLWVSYRKGDNLTMYHVTVKDMFKCIALFIQQQETQRASLNEKIGGTEEALSLSKRINH